jgi:WD40 repeat protein
MRNRDPLVMTCLAFSPDGSLLASGCTGTGNTESSSLADVYLWDIARAKALRHFPVHQGWVQSLSFSPDGKTLATSGPEPTIRVWDVATGRETIPQPGHRGWIRKLAISPADGTVFTCGLDGSVRRWDMASGRELGIFATFDSPIETIAFAADGKTLLLRDMRGGLVALWSVAERREIRRLPRIEERNFVRHAAFSPDGKTVASERRIWDAASGKVLVSFRDSDEENNRSENFYPLLYTPEGKQIITLERDGVRVWDIASGKEARWVLRIKGFSFSSIAISPDGRFLARGGVTPRVFGDPPIQLIEIASGQEVAILEGHEVATRDLAFSPDGRFLVSGSGDNRFTKDATVRVWDMATGRELRRFEGHLAAVNAIAVSPDGRSVVSASSDATALVWDISDLTGQPRTAQPITAEVMKTCWAELAGDDPRAAYRAAWALSDPSAVPFLRDHLRPAVAPDPKGIPAPSGPIAPPEVLRTLRAIAALERVGTPEALGILEQLARGNAGAIATRDAKAALDRVNRRLKGRENADSIQDSRFKIKIRTRSDLIESS